jgi:REP element-mobilizing transposase RayT
MGWPIRMYDSREIYFVTLRCMQGRLLLRPSPRTNEVLAGILARAARMFSVHLFGFVFASNHVHLIARAPEGNLPRFMQFLAANISRKVARLTGWRGAFWERRYSAEPILDDEALLGRLRYVLAHGVKERLVRRCRDWPGLNSLGLMLRSSVRSAKWFNWTRRWRDRRQLAADRYGSAWVEREELSLTILPPLAARSASARRRFCLRTVAAIEEDAARDPRPVFGVRAVLAQRPQFRPTRPARRPRPLCHTSIRMVLELFRGHYRSYVERFREASVAWRRGHLAANFPEGAVRPFLWSVPLPGPS